MSKFADVANRATSDMRDVMNELRADGRLRDACILMLTGIFMSAPDDAARLFLSNVLATSGLFLMIIVGAKMVFKFGAKLK